MEPFQVMTYLVACPQSCDAVIIDPAGDEDKLLALIETRNLRVKYILNTHGHADHVLGNPTLKNLLKIPVCMHEADDKFFNDPSVRETSSHELGLPPPDPVDIKLKDGDVLEVGTLNIEVIHTPGHTPGSVCYRVGENLFTGDTLFVGAAGRTDLTGGSLNTLIQSIEKKLIVLPKRTIVWPGHDYGESPTSTIGKEMEENPYITDFILE
ncbi:MAG: MBL fold metallo-hydrolase [Desulfobacteraceae bacterium]|nr:MBL fold metallo-hydrolase [Desulfobacteraceae bacterium]